jgi:ATP-dependent Clp protease ATP-binding subunit ClpB
VTHAQVQVAVVRMMGRGVESPADDALAFTGRAEDVVEQARREAAGAGREQADTEHILLALVQERDGAAVRILRQLDADPTAIRSALAS